MPSRPANTPLPAGTAGVLALTFAIAIALVTTPAARSGSSGAVAVQLRRGAVKELKSGKLLVASRNLPDPNFAATVILLAEYNAQGAMGLIVNRPTKVTLGSLLPGVEGPGNGATAFFGGPVLVSGVLGLMRSKSQRSDSRHVVGDVYLVNTGAVLKETIAAGTGPQRFRVYVGYAGWGPGQLESETDEGSWFVLDGDGEVVFDPEPESIWRRQIKRAEALSAGAVPDTNQHRG